MIAFPKVKRKRKIITIDYLDDLWRHCIRLEWRYMDPFEDENRGQVLQCHHIIRRSDMLLRWDPMNGILLTQEHHNAADTPEMRGKIFDHPAIDREYLVRMHCVDFKNYLVENGLAPVDFMLRKKQQLKDRIKVLGG